MNLVMEDTIKPEKSLSPPPPRNQTCDGNRIQQVLRKEAAAKSGLEFLNDLQRQLRLQAEQVPSALPRLEQIDIIKNRKRNYTVKIGFLGVTGAGKTTLINALLEYDDLLPTSHEKACTAVAIEIAYNHNASEDRLFRGEIVFVTRDEFRRELNQLFEDLGESDMPDDDDDIEEDLDREGRIAESVDKLKYVYPQINTTEKLKEHSAEELLEHPAVRDVIGTTREIYGGDKESFADILRQYTESDEYGKKTSALWPLVKVVKIFVKSEILKDGIVLVDLPGSMDSNTARSIAAENYQQELAVTCIVSPATRAISEKNAQDLLLKHNKRNLQLDGRYDARKLCFIISQTDRSFNYLHYSKHHANLHKTLRETWNEIETLRQKIKELGSRKMSLISTMMKHKDLQRQVLDIKFYLGESSAVQFGSKRKISEVQFESPREKLNEVTKLIELTKAEREKDAFELTSTQRRIDSNKKALWYAESRIVKSCIDNRNQLSAAAIESDYEATLKAMEKEANVPLKVFGVAAATHLKHIANPRYKQRGFTNIQDTQIGALRDWLISTTLDDRQQFAQAFLDGVEQLVQSIKPWIADTLGDAMLTSDQRVQWSSILDEDVDELKKRFTQLALNTSGNIKRQIQEQLYPKMKEAQILAGAASRKTAARWAQGVSWSTHRAINKRKGTWTDSNRRAHRWNDDLAHDFTGPLLVLWDQVLFNQIPAELDSFITKGDELIEEFTYEIAYEELENILANEIAREKEKVNAAIRKSHKLAVPAIKGFLTPMYHKCGNEKVSKSSLKSLYECPNAILGSGLYERNKETHQKQMLQGEKIHEAGRLAIQRGLDTFIRNLSAKLTKRFLVILRRIEYGIENFIDNNSVRGSRASRRRAVSTFKVQLRESVQPLIDKLEKDWNTEEPSPTPTKHGFMDGDQNDEDDFLAEEAGFMMVDDNGDEDFQFFLGLISPSHL
ncbi:hypothetical protein F5884DRAFT_866052 [Xylogone sp. PMI_703]|nr:hypothetical protein F5884DRAFT_866052 [Xylogone sp. PMI_703]